MADGMKARKRQKKMSDFLTNQQFRREGGKNSISHEIFNNLNISTKSKVPALPPMPPEKSKKIQTTQTSHPTPYGARWDYSFNTPLRARRCDVFHRL